MLVPMYIAEMAPPTIRGRLVGLYEIFVQIGTCVGFWVNYGISEHGPYGTASWMTPFGLQLIPGGVLIIGMLFMSESPRYLARTQGRESAEAGLSALRNLEKDHPYLIEELGHVMDQIEQEQIFAVGKGLKATVNMVCRKGNWNRLVIGNVMMIFMQMAGSNAINYFSKYFHPCSVTPASKSPLTSTKVPRFSSLLGLAVVALPCTQLASTASSV